MKHFIGGFAVGVLVVMRYGNLGKPATEMDNVEFFWRLVGIAILASGFGVAAWGLL